MASDGARHLLMLATAHSRGTWGNPDGDVTAITAAVHGEQATNRARPAAPGYA
jgi:hypothetical protein